MRGSNRRKQQDGRQIWISLRNRKAKVLFTDLKDFRLAYFRSNTCEFCDCKLCDVDRRKGQGRNIHRIRNSGPYSHDNVAVICRKCHQMITNYGIIIEYFRQMNKEDFLGKLNNG